MGIAKVVYVDENNQSTTWVDLTSDTVASGNLLSPETATGADGEAVTGSIATKTSANLTASGATVTAPAGYYATNASKSVASGSAATPATSITANPTISVNSSTGVITATTSASQSVTPTVSAGYVSSGTAGTVSVSGSATESLTTQAAQTIYPSTSDQSIASGRYLTGAQTIKGVLLTNLSADNIKKDVVVKVGDSVDDDRITAVTGTYEGGGGGGGDDTNYKAFLARSTNTPTLPNDMTTVGNYMCYQWAGLALTGLPNTITTIGDYAFYYCTSLALTSLPTSLTTINSNSFYRCTSLAITTIPSGVTSIGSSAFYQCTGLTSIYCAGNISNFGGSAFNGNSAYPMALTRAEFPNMTAYSIGTVFGNSTATSACQQLEMVDLGQISYLSANAFNNCYKLATMVLRKTGTVCTLSNVSALTNTPMSGYNSLSGTVYVPDGLISTYKTETNWSTLYNNGTITFAKIEGSPYEI